MDKKKNHVVPLNLKFVLRQGNPMLACGVDQCGSPGADQATCPGNVTNICLNSDFVACGAQASSDECRDDWGWSCSQVGGVDECEYDSNGSCGGQIDNCGYD